MFDELKDTFRELYRLAYEVYQANKHDTGENKGILGLVDLMTVEQSEESKIKDKELLDFLHSLDFETVKIIQTIMLLGREGKLNDEETPEKAYSKLRHELDQNGWRSKEDEVNYIFEKAPLYEYLKNGFKMLNINL